MVRMFNIFKRFFVFGTIFLLIAPDSGLTAKSAKDQSEVAEITGEGHAVLWREPTDIASRNLLYGSGGKQHYPRGPFKFLGEDRGGTNPKFDVRAANGEKWKVKLGIEARPETAASRFVW